MHSFKIRPDGYKNVRKKMLLWGIPIMLTGVVISFQIALQSNGSDVSAAYNSNNYLDWLVYIIPFVLILSFASFGLYRSLGRVKKMFASYELLITDNLISREVVNTPTISIYVNEVQEIIRHRNGSYMIKGTKANDLILVPKQIENREQLELILDQIKPVTTKGKAITQIRLLAVLSFINLGLMWCVFAVDNKTIVAIAGTLFFVIFIYNFIRIQKSKNIDYRTKKTRWISFLALLVVLYFLITKLTGSTLF